MDSARHLRLPEGSSVELKWLDSDEFAHWTSPEAFAESARTRRKRREYRLFTDLAAGRWDGQPGVTRIEAPEGVHVIDFVTRIIARHQSGSRISYTSAWSARTPLSRRSGST